MISAAATSAAADLVLAHHPFVVAAPFVVPAVLVSAVVGGVVWRDRRDAGPAGSGDDAEPGRGQQQP